MVTIIKGEPFLIHTNLPLVSSLYNKHNHIVIFSCNLGLHCYMQSSDWYGSIGVSSTVIIPRTPPLSIPLAFPYML